MGVRRFGASVVRVGERVRVERGRPAQLHADLALKENGPRPNRAPNNRARPLPATRHVAGLPGSALNMPNPRARPPPRPARTCTPRCQLGVIRCSAYSRHRALVILSTRIRAPMPSGPTVYLTASACPHNSSRKNTLPVDRPNTPQMTRPLGSTPTAPSRGFTATTSRSAGASRDGTHCLAVQPLGRLPYLC